MLTTPFSSRRVAPKTAVERIWRLCLLVGMILGGLLMGMWWMLASLVFGGA